MAKSKNFKAFLVEQASDQQFKRTIIEKSIEELPQGDVLVRVHFSSLNYKDALSATGNKGVTRNYPHTPGIDAAGEVEQSSNEHFKPGDEVIVTSYDLGMNTAGGFEQYIRVPSEWVVPMPKGFTARDSMVYGTAGFTAGLSVYQLRQHGVTPEKGEILVSGATGGVGGIAVSILAKAGYSVAAVNGLSDAAGYLKEIGAESVISIEDATDKSGRPLLKSRWAGSIDTVGGDILATTVKSLKSAGVVTCCGNVASADLPLSVFPFILRGAILVGIDSQNCPMTVRKKIWEKLADEWRVPLFEQRVSEITLDELDERIDMMMQRKHQGRTIVNLESEK
ncbi:MAG: YhdH/YhfP family quinone oxidoreductase [Desulfobacterales bacterium]